MSKEAEKDCPYDEARSKQIESQLKRRDDWRVLLDLAERLFVADYPNCPASHFEPFQREARTAFDAAQVFIDEANRRAPK